MKYSCAVARCARRLFLAVVLFLAWTMIPGAEHAVAGSIIFSDDFTGSTLNPAWQILPGAGAYSLVGGSLRYFNQGPLSYPFPIPTPGWSTSLSLALPFTGTNWQIDIEATYSLDWLLSDSYTGPSSANTSNSSGAQAGQVFVSFDAVTDADRSALGGSNSGGFNRFVDAWYGYNFLWANYGSTYVTNLLNPDDLGITNNIADGTYWYQFIRDGGTLAINYSYDGLHYSNALSVQLANPSSSFNELVLSGTTYLNASSFTDYGFVTITDTSVPEPSTLTLMGIGIIGLIGGRWLRKK